MFVVPNIGSHLAWQYRILKCLLETVSRPTIENVVARVGAQFAQMFSFLIPLKVIILLGSDGIPRYFRFFMTEENRDPWIAILIVATFGLYILSIVLTKVADRILQHGSEQFFELRAGNNPLSQKKRNQFLSCYNSLCNNYANVAMLVLATLIILVLKPFIAVVLFLLVLAEIEFTKLVVASNGGGLLRPLRDYIADKPKEYIGYLSVINFFALFLLLICAFLILGELNLIVAILVFILGRRALKALEQFSKSAVTFESRRAKMQSLVGLHPSEDSGQLYWKF